MADNEPENSVRNEQFSEINENAENIKKPETFNKKYANQAKDSNNMKEEETSKSNKDLVKNSKSGKKKKSQPEPEAKTKGKSVSGPKATVKGKEEQSKKSAASGSKSTKTATATKQDKTKRKTGKKVVTDDKSAEKLKKPAAAIAKKDKEKKLPEETAEKKKVKKSAAPEQPLPDVEDKKIKEDKKPEKEDENKQQVIEKEEVIDYSSLNKKDLVDTLKDIIDNKSILQIKNDVELIKINFYKKHKADIEKKRKNFLQEGGDIEDFKVEEDPLERMLKEYLKKYKEIKAEYNKKLEDEKHENLEKKYQIIEEIKDLVNRKESINKTFQEFRELQKQWRSIGLVPQQNVKDLWETYHHHVEAFYDYIKINKELRDLDLKKNLESKIELCENAEELLLEPNIISAFNELQKLHEQWREIGPVPPDMRVEIWERFKETTSKINKKHQEYFLNLKKEQKKNLEAKSVLCEKVEEINSMAITSHKEWENKSNEIIELQKVWKTIGFAPKKDNNKIYSRFRNACDNFFNKKREFYSQNREQQNDNLQLKTDLCVQAEALQDSDEWKKTTEELITLQKRWKEIGPVPYKYSDKIWRRFRQACDKFFERKETYFSQIDNSYEQNLKKKEDLIKKIEKLDITDKIEECLKKLKEFQREWAEIGFVPYKSKDEIQDKYRNAINKKFDELNVDENRKNILKFKTKLDNLKNKPNGIQRIRQERDKYNNKLKQLENDIVLWENNIGFFTKTKNAESMINGVESKIEDAKKRIALLKEKIRLIDESE
jgi:hypothetical protein